MFPSTPGSRRSEPPILVSGRNDRDVMSGTRRTGASGWRPLIVDADRRAAIAAVLVEIVAELEAWRRDQPRRVEDDGDYAILRAYVAADDTVPDPDDEAGRALSAAVAQIGDRRAPGLWGGAARIAFVVGHLGAEDDAGTVCEMIELSLTRALTRPTGEYDLTGGLVGIAVPVLQRIAAGTPSPSSLPLAHGILDHLERLARPMSTGLAWHTPPTALPAWQRDLAPGGYVNHGLAHGVAGVVAILARYIAAGVEVGRARALLDGAVAHLRKVAGPAAGARYPARTRHDDSSSRVAWCYGDLGVAVALLSAASATGRDDWRALALDLALGMAACPFVSAQVFDTGLCHGASGVAHLFNRLHQATGEAELARAADAWFARTLAMRGAGAIAGFPHGLPIDGAITWKPRAELLIGVSGVALALHAAISPIEPSWDRLLLADLPPVI